MTDAPWPTQVPDGVKMEKDVPLALIKGSTVFVNYLAAVSVPPTLPVSPSAHALTLSPSLPTNRTTHPPGIRTTNRAHDVATDQNHKTIAATHVLEAVSQLGWDDEKELLKHLKRELAGPSSLSPSRSSFPLPLMLNPFIPLETAFREATEAKKSGGKVPAAAAAPSAKGKAVKMDDIVQRAGSASSSASSRPPPAAAAPAVAKMAVDDEDANGNGGGDGKDREGEPEEEAYQEGDEDDFEEDVEEEVEEDGPGEEEEAEQGLEDDEAMRDKEDKED